MSGPAYDVVIYGATGFTGRQAARYLAGHAPETLRLAIAGRGKAKLEAIRAALGPRGERFGVVVADSGDPASVDAMVAAARVVLTTAGPFARYGTPVVEACARRGVDYVDITGETPWVRDMIDRHHATAREKGARIVPLCGFDSVPSDLGTWMLVDFVRRTWGQDVRLVRAAFRIGGRAGANGGSLATALLLGESGETARLKDPVLLSPAPFRTDEERRRNPDPRGAVLDPDLDRWLAPFFMGPINTRVVRRSHALFSEEGRGYGPEFRYEERMEAGTRAKAWLVAGATAALAGVLETRLGRSLIRRVAAAPGEGPSEEAMDGGLTRCRYVALAADGRKALGEMRFAGDPGNRATVLMMCEGALCLALDRDRLPRRAGIITPAFAFEGVLLERLRRAGMTWEVRGAGAG